MKLHKITRVILGEEATVYWNHRVMRRIINEETHYAIEEVFYNEDGSILGWTSTDEVIGDSQKELREVLNWMLAALNEPLLDEMALQAEADAARENGEEDLYPSERLSIEEVLESLGLEREDVEENRNANLGRRFKINSSERGKLPSKPANQPLVAEDFQ